MPDPIFLLEQLVRGLPAAPATLYRATRVLVAKGPAAAPLLAACWAWTLAMTAAMFRHGLPFAGMTWLRRLGGALALGAFVTADWPALWAAALGGLGALHLETRRCPGCRGAWADLAVAVGEDGATRKQVTCPACGYSRVEVLGGAPGDGPP